MYLFLFGNPLILAAQLIAERHRVADQRIRPLRAAPLSQLTQTKKGTSELSYSRAAPCSELQPSDMMTASAGRSGHNDK